MITFDTYEISNGGDLKKKFYGKFYHLVKRQMLSVIGVTAVGKYIGGYNELILFRKC